MALVGSGVLGPGQAEHFKVALRGGITYRVYVHPTEPGVDFDLYVHDENGNLVAVDQTTDADARCLIKPRWDGPFLLSVKAASGMSTYSILVEGL